MDRLNSDNWSGLKRLLRETRWQHSWLAAGRDGCDGPVKGWVGSLPPGDNGPGDYPWIGPKFWIILIIDRFLEIAPAMVWLWGGLGRSGHDSVEILRWNVRDVIVIATITTIHSLTQIKQWSDDLNSNAWQVTRAIFVQEQLWQQWFKFGATQKLLALLLLRARGCF